MRSDFALKHNLTFIIQPVAQYLARGDEAAVKLHFNGLKVVYKRMPELEYQDLTSAKSPISEPIEQSVEVLRKNLDDL